MAIRKELPFAWYEVDAVEAWLDEQVLQEMVYSVNREEVPADEILSDHPFRYEREMNRLCMI